MDKSDCRIHLNSVTTLLQHWRNKAGLGMASSIKSQPNPDDLQDFVLTKAEKVCCFGSPVGNDKILQVIY